MSSLSGPRCILGCTAGVHLSPLSLGHFVKRSLRASEGFRCRRTGGTCTAFSAVVVARFSGSRVQSLARGKLFSRVCCLVGGVEAISRATADSSSNDERL